MKDCDLYDLLSSSNEEFYLYLINSDNHSEIKDYLKELEKLRELERHVSEYFYARRNGDKDEKYRCIKKMSDALG